MRTRFIFSLLFMASTCIGLHAQIVVDSIGNVGVGTEDAPSALSIGGGNSDYYTFINPKSGYDYALGINNTNKGVKIMNHTSANTNTVGLQVLASSGNTNQPYYGIISEGGYTSSTNYGIYTTLLDVPSSAWFQAALYARVGGTAGGPLTSGTFAGYFGGNVAICGNLTAVSIYCNTINNTNAGSNTRGFTQLSDEERVTDNLQRLNILEVHDPELMALKGRTDETAAWMDTPKANSYNVVSKVGNEDFRNTYCIAANELREIYPNLVYEDKEGNVSINYIEMVPLLVQSIKELRAEIDELKGTSPRKTAKKKPVGTTNMESEIEYLISLEQNDPNPFTSETTIAVTLPESTKNASIVIYDLTGKKQKEIEVLGRGETSVCVTSEGLTSGMYLYSFIADGKVISTKRMILN